MMALGRWQTVASSHKRQRNNSKRDQNHGIAGRFHPAQLAPEPGWAAAASALLAHRGPDGEGHWEDERCDLVHRRLALIDLSPTGAQPMSNEDGAVLVVYNGEIYNYRALTAELKARGHRFR